MNERIRELAEQCVGSRPYNTFDYEKFAELIVRECVQTLLDNTPEQFTNEEAEEDWDRGYDQAMRDCVHHIQEHFGVE
ncbi:hypothetical protein EB118_25980 [bacterium]|nr:hypothetical protein [Actinomycetota bacterium]NDG33490.1 hypothetical protein [bacterium]